MMLDGPVQVNPSLGLSRYPRLPPLGARLDLICTTAPLAVSSVAGGGTRAVAAEAAGISESTLYKWLRRGTEDAKTTQTVLDPDDYTIRELRALARTAQIPGFSRMDKGKLATAITAKPSEYFQFVRCIKKGIIYVSAQEIVRFGSHPESVGTILLLLEVRDSEWHTTHQDNTTGKASRSLT